MSFLTDLFEGNTGNLGNDLWGSPTAIAETLGAVALPFAAFAAPALLGGEAAAGGLGGLFGADAAAGGLSAAEASTAGGLGDFSFLNSVPALGGAPGAGAVGAEGAIGEAGIPGAGGAFSGTGTAATMGGGGDIAVGGAAPGGGLPSADWMSTGAAGDWAGNIPQPMTGFEGGTATPANPLTGGTFGSPAPAPGAPGAPPEASWLPPWAQTGLNTLKQASPAIGVAGLGNALYQGYQSKQQQAKLNQQEATAAGNASVEAQVANTAAQPLLNQGSTLMSYLTTGTLPPQFMKQVDASLAAARAAIIQGYSTRGMSSDPRQNSSLTQDLNNLETQKAALMTQLETMLSTAGNQMVQTANSLLASGLQATQLSAELPIQVSKLNVDLNTQMSNAIANFAAAINGGRGNAGQKGGGITLQP